VHLFVDFRVRSCYPCTTVKNDARRLAAIPTASDFGTKPNRLNPSESPSASGARSFFSDETGLRTAEQALGRAGLGAIAPAVSGNEGCPGPSGHDETEFRAA